MVANHPAGVHQHADSATRRRVESPALIVHGEKAHSRYFSEDAFKSLGSQNKELYIVPGANHTDLYDNTRGKIPFDKFEQFFKANLH